jgi:hypothetical protein
MNSCTKWNTCEKLFHVEHLTYRIESNQERTRFALFVTRHEGPALFDFSSFHFSTAASRSTLKRRVARMFPTAVPEGAARRKVGR